MFNYDQDVMREACELLGSCISPLNMVQIACMLGEEEIALDLVEFVHRCTSTSHKKLLLHEFLGKSWGNENTTLHLASFQGMSDLVQRLLEYGSNSRKVNAVGFKVS